LGTLSCSKAKKEPYKIPENAFSLIAGESGKTWKLARRFNGKTRMNMGDCFLSFRQTFKPDLSVMDNSGKNKDCGESLIGTWRLTKDKKENYYIKIISDQIPRLMNIEEDYKYFKILHVSEDQLTLQFRHKQFSNKERTMTDIYVPEEMEVEGRDFHW
ncbi:lipocalin family protein, partial [Xanthovirga aplysinae]|uniref:lipocalin family protein n=1 Tax=Xanthovirga aplysinae TaxID=2529853 RepID=UPI0012BBC8DC